MIKAKVGVKQGHPGYFRLIYIGPFHSKQVEHDRSDLLQGQGEARIEIH